MHLAQSRTDRKDVRTRSFCVPFDEAQGIVRANDDHEAKFPIELPTRVIRLLSDPGDIVLDCFLGSGTTALACLREKRRYIGIEREERYVQQARERILTELTTEPMVQSVEATTEQYVQIASEFLIKERGRDTDRSA